MSISDWGEVQNRLGQVLGSVESVKKDIDNLKEQQKYMHGTNQDDIQEMKERIEALDCMINGNESIPGLRTEMATILAYGRASAFWGKVAAGLLALALTTGGLYVAYLELHHRISSNEQPHVVSESVPQDAKN